MKTLINLLPVVLLFVLLLLESALTGAPPIQWQKTFGGSNPDEGRSVQQTSDGGYIITGFTSSFGPTDPNVYLIKTDPNGDIRWQKTFGGSGRDQGGSVQQTTDGGYIISGLTQSNGAGNWDVYLIKTDPNGNLQWQKTFGEADSDEYGSSVQQTTDGGYIIAGYTTSYGTGDTDVYLVKTDPNGDSKWQNTFGWINSEYGFSVQQTFDGGYVVAGYIWFSGGGVWDVYLIKTDPNGYLKWAKTFGGSGGDSGNSVQQTSDGGYVIVGYTNSFGAGYFDVYLVKTDPNGNSQWQKTFGGSDYDMGYSVQQTSDGGYIVAGYAGAVDSYRGGDFYIIKTDPDGNSAWQKTVGGGNREVGYSAQQTEDGGYVIAGYTDSYGAGYADVYLIKLCSDGTLSADFNCNGTVYYEDLAILAFEWLQPPVMLFADIFPEFGDSIVNGFDFAAFANDWLQTTAP